MDLKKLYQDVVDGNAPEVQAGVKAALEAGIGAEEILGSGLIAAMAEVGQRYEEGDLFVPEMLIAARAMQAGLHILKPYLAKDDVKAAGIVAIGTVKGDLHDIGKNLVAMMWKGANFQVIDLGTNVAPQKFVDAAKQHNVDLVGLSALLTTTMPAIKSTVEALRAAGIGVAKIVIGGAPVTQAYADQVGADGFAPDAASAPAAASAISVRLPTAHAVTHPPRPPATVCIETSIARNPKARQVRGRRENVQRSTFNAQR